MNTTYFEPPTALGPAVCVRTISSLDSLSIASSNNKTDGDDDVDELPFHLLQHGRRYVHVGDCVCARLAKSGGAGFLHLEHVSRLAYTVMLPAALALKGKKKESKSVSGVGAVK